MNKEDLKQMEILVETLEKKCPTHNGWHGNPPHVVGPSAYGDVDCALTPEDLEALALFKKLIKRYKASEWIMSGGDVSGMLAFSDEK